MKTKRYKFKSKGRSASYDVWVTRQNPTKGEVLAKRNQDADRALKDIMSCGSLALRLMLKSGKKPQITRKVSSEPRRKVDCDVAQAATGCNIGCSARTFYWRKQNGCIG